MQLQILIFLLQARGCRADLSGHRGPAEGRPPLVGPGLFCPASPRRTGNAGAVPNLCLLPITPYQSGGAHRRGPQGVLCELASPLYGQGCLSRRSRHGCQVRRPDLHLRQRGDAAVADACPGPPGL